MLQGLRQLGIRESQRTACFLYHFLKHFIFFTAEDKILNLLLLWYRALLKCFLNNDILWQVFPCRDTSHLFLKTPCLNLKQASRSDIKSADSFQVSSQEFLTVLVIRASFYMFLENKLGMFLALRLVKSQGEILVLWVQYLSEHFR